MPFLVIHHIKAQSSREMNFKVDFYNDLLLKKGR